MCDALKARCSNPHTIFLTGDLGFMALEPLRDAMGERFINAGLAEQNMVSVAAAMAKQALEVWVYSIAPFCYARPFEQIRNDVCFHQLPVNLIGNGGGYGYGVMGPTHHAIEDYGVLLTLPNMRVYAPVFDEDVEAVIARAGGSMSATYVRLGRGEPPVGYVVPAYTPWRQLCHGAGPVVIALGPLAGTYVESFSSMPDARRPNLWAIAELPIVGNPPPDALLQQIHHSPQLVVAEEHVQRGSFASELVLYLAALGIAIPKLTHLYARAHHFSRYGSQPYLRKQSLLDPQSMLMALEGKLYG